MKIAVLRRLIGLATMAVTLRFGVFTFVMAIMCVNAPLSILVYAWPNSRYLGYTPGMLAKACLALASVGISLSMVNQGSSEVSFMIAIRSQDRDRAVRALHKAFFS